MVNVANSGEEKVFMNKNNKSGFTLIELLVVIAIIGILAGMFMGTFSVIRTSAKKSTARSDIEQIKTAWLQYMAEYHKLPDNITEMDSKALKIICGHTDDDNRLEIHFLDFSKDAVDEDYLDPWGSVYKVIMAVDRPWDEVTVNGLVVHSAVASWSLGPDMLEFTKDDIVSWH